jgi:hypothetical protein
MVRVGSRIEETAEGRNVDEVEVKLMMKGILK